MATTIPAEAGIQWIPGQARYGDGDIAGMETGRDYNTGKLITLSGAGCGSASAIVSSCVRCISMA